MILNEMSNNGSALPVFKTDEERSYFLVILPIHPAFKGRITRSGERQNVEPNKRPRRSKEELRVLVIETLTQKGELSMNEIAAALGYKKLNNTLRTVVNQMVEDDEAEYLYPDKPKSSNQKIRLKKAGLL